MSMLNPSENGENGENGDGRDSETGRFARGNRAAVGHRNTLGQQAARLRAALLKAVTPGDVRAIVETLIRRARDGDAVAVRVLFGYVLGRPVEHDILERIDALEADAESEHRSELS